MKPEVWGVAAWGLCWGFAAALAMTLHVLLLRRRGVPPGRALVALLLTAAIALAGAKAEFAWETSTAVSLWPSAAGARLPGGMIALVVAMPVVLRLLGLPILRFLDTVGPIVGIAIFFGRFGCLLNGCCFGIPTTLPWGIRFPVGSRPYFNQMREGLLPLGSQLSLPTHPLQLYFGVDGLLIAGVLLWMLGRARYEGQVWLWFLVLRPWSKFALEHLRGRDITVAANQSGQVELVVAIVATLTLVTVEVARRVGRPVPAARRI